MPHIPAGYVRYLYSILYTIYYRYILKLVALCSVPNKAHSQHTWTNDKRHTWKQWKYGHSSLAVDGKENTNLPNCAIMDNYYVDKASSCTVHC